jgi:predicted dehydrogenase
LSATHRGPKLAGVIEFPFIKDSRMKEVRLGVIGGGNMGQVHMKGFALVNRLKFAAVSDAVGTNVKKAVDTYGVKGFDSAEALMDSGLVDAVLIATPHYFHPAYSIAAMRRGLHVLTEKPVSVTAKQAEAVNAEHHKHRKLVYAAMFQMRLSPIWKKVRELVATGQVGKVQRVTWIITNWFRSQAYYDSGGWRATWAGEGGGVLLNQCPHNLELFQWVLGMPKSVRAFISLGKYHRIEVEDDVTAYFEYPNGATGTFITTTGEAPGTNRLEIAGDRGRLVADGSTRIELVRTDVNVREFCKTTRESFPTVPTSKATIEVAEADPQCHKVIAQNFVDAILDGAELVAPAEEGLNSVELANAMIQSGLTGKAVNFPSDRAAYDRLLKKLIRESTFKKGAVKEAKVDMLASFKK